jgi:DNA-binding MarR family transcriptional regulator
MLTQTLNEPATGHPDLSSDLRFAVMRLRRRLVTERHPDNELSLSAMAVLGVLFVYGDRSVGELAAHERVQPPSMTRLVNHLSESGHVTREQHDTDGRQVLVRLTDRGRESVEADRDRRDAWLSCRLAELTDAERSSLAAAAPILERLANA